jgi:hypothetical protein
MVHWYLLRMPRRGVSKPAPGLQGLNTTNSRSLMARKCFALAVMSGM